MTSVQSQNQSSRRGPTRLIPGGKSLERTSSTNGSVRRFVNPSRTNSDQQQRQQHEEVQLELFDRD